MALRTFIVIPFPHQVARSGELDQRDRSIWNGRQILGTWMLRVVHWTFCLLVLVAASSASAEVRTAFAWADSPNAASYVPAAAYVKRDDAEIRITRTGVGEYLVALGSLISGRGNVQVSAYGPAANACQVESWSAAGTRVRCFDAAGRPSDSRFTVLAVRAQNDASVAYVWANDPTSSDYTPLAAYAESSTPARIRRSSLGRYVVLLAPDILSTGANVQVTAYGSAPRRCGVIGWGGDSVEIACTDVSGHPADARFSLLAIKGNVGLDDFAFAWANEPNSADYVPSPAYAFAPGANPRVQRASVGQYTVTLNGTIGNVQTTAYAAPGAFCNPQSWGPTAVNIVCFGPDGRPVDTQFTILATHAPSIQGGVDLTVALEGIPATLQPGGSLGLAARAVAQNIGGGMAPGNRQGQRGYMIDIVLSRDQIIPEGFSTFRDTFREDVLLRGGRASNTTDLAGGTSAKFDIANDTIPTDTPAGNYFLCARIDPGSIVAEANKTNNISCQHVRVKAPATANDFQGIAAAARRVASSVRLQLDRAFYDAGQTVTARLQFASLNPSDERFAVHVISKSGDIEFVVLKKSSPGFYETEVSRAQIRTASGTPTRYDGVLETLPGEQLTALVFFDQRRLPVGADVVSDTAIIGAAAANAGALPRATVALTAMSEAERESIRARQPFGVVAARGGLPVEIAIGQVLFTPNGMFSLSAFIEYSGGTVAAGLPNGRDGVTDGSDTMYLVTVPLDRARDDRLAELRSIFQDTDDVIVTQADVLKTFALILEYRMKGFAVSANPRLQQHGLFSTPETDGRMLLDTMKLADSTGSSCPDENCPLNVQALWAHMALWDLDTREIPVAFIDQGFATASPDFRRPSRGRPFIECDFEPRCGGSAPWDCDFTPRCGPGVANTRSTVGDSLVGTRGWHGTGSVTTAGAALNNGWTSTLSTPLIERDPTTGAITTTTTHTGGSAGPGGQVLVPMMYRMGLVPYAFQMGMAIQRATDDGAACINIAAGYPCNVRLTWVGDFELCNPAVRAAACGVLINTTIVAAASAAAAACAVSGLFGFLDVIIPGAGTTLAVATCGASTAAGITAAGSVTAACISLVALGDTRGPMQAGVDHASSRGVPIIASMGNTFDETQVDPAIRPFLDPGTLRMDGDQLQMVPAVLDPVIAIGAAAIDGTGFLVNSQMRGASVSVWAPEMNRYLGPPISDNVPRLPSEFTRLINHSGTSAASSYVTGIVAAMQAANPQLDPRTPALTAAQRRAIPGRIDAILQATATPMGMGIAEPGRLPMVNPLEAVRAAWGLEPTGFNTRLNFDDDGTDDTVSGARDLSSLLNGAIITVPGVITVPVVGGVIEAPTRSDVDFYTVRPSPSSPRGATFTVELRFPERFRGQDAGALQLSGEEWTEVLNTATTTGAGSTAALIRKITFRSRVARPHESIAFRIEGVGNDDNVYTVEKTEFPVLNADRFDLDTAVNLAASRPNNNVPARAVPIGVPDGLNWTPEGGAGIRFSLNIPDLNFHEPDDEDWFVFSAFPTGPGHGTCVSSLEIPWNPDLRYEVDYGSRIEELHPERVRGPTGRASTLIRITAPPSGLRLRITSRPGATTTAYALEMTFTGALDLAPFLCEGGGRGGGGVP